MKTTLTIDIDYDPGITDPEALASTADRLLKTALSTPGIMKEYGTPRFGEFFVLSSHGDAVHNNQPVYALRIDGPLLRRQRRWLWELAGKTAGDGREHLEGVIALLDEIADQAHDRYGIDCLQGREDSVNDSPSEQILTSLRSISLTCPKGPLQ